MANKPSIIYWVDSASAAGAWRSKGDALTPDDIVSVGFVIDRTDEYVTICQSEATDEYGGILSIPMATVKAIHDLTYSPPRSEGATPIDSLYYRP